MKVVKDGHFYKVAKISGPKHNLLGLALDDAPVLTAPRIEILQSDKSNGAAAILPEEVLAQAMTGVEEANQQFKVTFYIRSLQYVATDTPDSTIYAHLAKLIVEQAVKDKMHNATMPSP